MASEDGTTGVYRGPDGRDRDAVEAWLAALVRENRFTIAVVFPAVGAVLLVFSAAGRLPGPLSFNPLLVVFGTLVMRLPLVAGLLPAVDRRALAGFAVLTAYTYGVELLGVTAGIPYGRFEYLVHLGPMLFGLVPAGLPLFFAPLVVNAYLLVLLVVPSARTSRLRRVGLAVGTVVLADLVLDPGAVALGFWRYPGGGAYYGVPLSNYAGWVVSGAVAVALVDVALDAEAVHERLVTCEFLLDDLVSFTLLWGGIALLYGLLVPTAVAAAFALALSEADRFDLVIG